MTTPFLRPHDTILFQGDSITDVGRCSTPDGLGTGYVSLLCGWFQARYPATKYRVLNRGVGGDRTVELLARWKVDCLDLKPDVLSVSIGVNDVWRLRGEWNGQSFVTKADFEANYRSLLDQAVAAGIGRFVLMSPTTIAEENDSALVDLLDERTEQVKGLARDYGAIYVPTREALNRALKDAPSTRWTADGCHPTTAGHALLAATWLQAIGL
jgi:lysophospholipase L1-like esterase